LNEDIAHAQESKRKGGKYQLGWSIISHNVTKILGERKPLNHPFASKAKTIDTYKHMYTLNSPSKLETR
jgi:hypothetical protein